jgi:hypothetical protein
MNQSNEYSNINGDYQATSNEYIQNWEQFASGLDSNYQQDISQSDSMTDQTTSFGFQQEEENIFQYNQKLLSEEINPEMDYETLIRTKDLYFDPDPQIIRKPTPKEPVVYNQNIMVRFLQPPPVPQGPLIIREVRPPQPPPPPPLVNINPYSSKTLFLFLKRLFVNEHHHHFHLHHLFFVNDLHRFLLL